MGDLVEFPLLSVTLATSILALTPADLQVELGLLQVALGLFQVENGIGKVTLHRMLAALALVDIAFVIADFLAPFGACSANWP
jgi:hypothetical protein